MNPRVVFFGTPEFVIPVVSALHKNGWLAGIVTTPDKKVGRKQTLTPSPVKQWALRHKIPVFAPEQLDQNLDPALFVLAAYGHLLPQFILDIPKFGALNIHPSLLPKYRGPSPIQSAILSGDKVSGVTIIRMDQKMDHGPIIFTKEISLSDRDTLESLSKQMFKVGADLLTKIIPDFIEGKIKLTPQNDKEATFTHLVKKEDGYFDINNPPSPEQLDKTIRAYYPWPNAWTRWNNKIVKFYPNRIVQMEGKKPMKIEEFLKGHPDFPLK